MVQNVFLFWNGLQLPHQVNQNSPKLRRGKEAAVSLVVWEVLLVVQRQEVTHVDGNHCDKAGHGQLEGDMICHLQYPLKKGSHRTKQDLEVLKIY